MKEVNRPEGDEAWRFYDSSLNIAWKTGTSFGNRDAWAIGTNSRYVVGVWVGNASGEGRPQLTGVESAAPISVSYTHLDVYKRQAMLVGKMCCTCCTSNMPGWKNM